MARTTGRKREERFAKAEDWRSFVRELDQETDRAAALLGAAMLDCRLERLLSAFMVDDPAVVGPLLEPSGPLGSLATRIRLAYALGLVSKDERDDLTLVRDIRNRFAHELHGLSFSERGIARAARALRAPLLPMADEVPNGFRFEDARRAFDLAIGALSVTLGRATDAATRDRRFYRPERIGAAGRRTRG